MLVTTYVPREKLDPEAVNSSRSVTGRVVTQPHDKSIFIGNERSGPYILLCNRWEVGSLDNENTLIARQTTRLYFLNNAQFELLLFFKIFQNIYIYKIYLIRSSNELKLINLREIAWKRLLKLLFRIINFTIISQFSRNIVIFLRVFISNL